MLPQPHSLNFHSQSIQSNSLLLNYTDQNLMENPIKLESLAFERNQEYPKSPEFEFWMVRNPSVPQPHILTADQLFSDGILLPLHTVDTVSSLTPEPAVDDAVFEEVTDGPQLTAVTAGSDPATGSRRWKDIFRKSESKSSQTKETTTSTDQKLELPKNDTKRERRTSSGGGQTNAAELNIINIWPFSRSRSAKTISTRSKASISGRKVSSAPCSRSNSGSESKPRKLPGSPARGGVGVHVGRSSPVWQARRGGFAGISRLSVVDRESLNLGHGEGMNGNVCKEGMAALNGGDIGSGGIKSGGSHNGSGVVNRFNFRSLFSTAATNKKVY